MKKSPYILEELSIRKMDGFPSGMEILKDLAPNINIITGLNGSGKSSTARAIQQLIWQNNTKGISLQGTVQIEDNNWEIDIDSGRNRVERNGNIEQIKGLPAKEGYHRYLLALHDFIEGNENDLAKEIAKHSIGGFDLDSAADGLGYSSRIQTLGATEFKNYAATEKKFRAVREDQKSLKRNENRLFSLNDEKIKAENALKYNEFYQKAAEFLEVKLEFDQLTEELNQFPASIKNLTGKEVEQIEELESLIEDSKKKIEKAKIEIDKSKGEINKLSISEEEIEDKTIEETEYRIDKLSQLNNRISDLKEKIIQEKSREKSALNSIDSTIDTEKWKNLNIQDVSGLEKLLQNANQVLGEKEYLLSEIRILEEEAKNLRKEKQSSETFSHGIKTLSEWLKEPIESDGIPLKTVLTISSFAIISAIVTYFIGWIGILIGFILFIIGFIITKYTKSNSSYSLKIRENDFMKSGLNPPSNWNPKSITNRIDELINGLINCKEAEKLSLRLNEYKTRLEHLQVRMNKVAEEREKWVIKLQYAPGFPSNNSNDFSSLYWFLTNVKSWQEAHLQKIIFEEKLENAEMLFYEELEKINHVFTHSKLISASDFVEAKATFNQLKNEESNRKSQKLIIQQQNRISLDQEDLIFMYNGKISKVYENSGLVNGDKNSLHKLINQLEVYNSISQNHYSAKQAYLKIERILLAHSLFEENKTELENLNVDQANEKAIQNKEIADKLDDIKSEIFKIEAEINLKKKGHELEDILTQKEEDLEALHQLYENNLAQSTGDIIIRELKNETQNKNRPEVFRKANEIFTKITLGRYTLKLNEKGNTSFEAIDNELKRSFNLSELSTGTRVQLLLSVRLAYVETVESSIKLPLLADELLANSDDERAKAIIEALIEISRQGRQVFYFTAQADEVGKWISHLNKTKLEHKVIQLNNKGNETLNYGQFPTNLDKFSFSIKIPSPIGKSHDEYKNLISVSSFNLQTQNSSKLPLWYLIEDVDLLYSILKRGIKSWGQLESYVKHNGKISGLNESLFKQFSNQIKVINKFQELHNIGRSLPIDRAILQESGKVSSSFIDKVSEKLNELNGDPRLLIQALKNGEVSRFRSDNADELEQFLLFEGYIDDKEIMKISNISIRIQALISTLELDNLQIEKMLDRILNTK